MVEERGTWKNYRLPALYKYTKISMLNSNFQYLKWELTPLPYGEFEKQKINTCGLHQVSYINGSIICFKKLL